MERYIGFGVDRHVAAIAGHAVVARVSGTAADSLGTRRGVAAGAAGRCVGANRPAADIQLTADLHCELGVLGETADLDCAAFAAATVVTDTATVAALALRGCRIAGLAAGRRHAANGAAGCGYRAYPDGAIALENDVAALAARAAVVDA